MHLAHGRASPDQSALSMYHRLVTRLVAFLVTAFFLFVSWGLTTLRLFPELWEPGSHLPEVSGAFPAAGYKETLFAHRSSSGLYFFGLLVSISNSGKNKKRSSEAPLLLPDIKMRHNHLWFDELAVSSLK